ncbi:MAG: dTMP kinase [Candidatus Gracilibacteria bacterium]
MFIAFEGVDGAGKDTQLKLFLSYLIDQDKHRVVLKSREPSRMTDAGKRLNEIAQKHIQVSPLETAELFALDRRELQTFRENLLASDVWIVSSRCDLTTYAYQGYASGISFDEIYELHQYILRPKITLFIDISVETMLQRLGNREGGKEIYEQESFLRKCHEGYQKAIEYLRLKGENIIVIDGEGSIQEVAERVQQGLEKFLYSVE